MNIKKIQKKDKYKQKNRKKQKQKSKNKDKQNQKKINRLQLIIKKKISKKQKESF